MINNHIANKSREFRRYNGYRPLCEICGKKIWYDIATDNFFEINGESCLTEEEKIIKDLLE